MPSAWWRARVLNCSAQVMGRLSKNDALNDFPVGLVTRYSCGVPGSGLDGLLTAIDEVLNETTRLTHTSGYDAVGNLIAQTDPLHRSSLHLFDARRRAKKRCRESSSSGKTVSGVD